MALEVVSMEELRLQVLDEPARTGETVAEVCRRRGISRETFYLYRRHYGEEGIAGSSRARAGRASHPGASTPCSRRRSASYAAAIPARGARRIRAELRRAGIEAPATSTVHQALRRNHLVSAQPPRKVRAKKRLERETSNDLWQIDATQVLLADRSEAWIVDCVDDHARLCLRPAPGCSLPPTSSRRSPSRDRTGPRARPRRRRRRSRRWS